MAEFTKVIHEWTRMCKTYSDAGGCMKCPMTINSICGYISDDNGTNNRKISKAKALKIEADIMAWAAEHPEPVYPSWIDWLMSEGVIPTNYMAANSTDSGIRAGTFYVTSKAFEHIPADIAQKLGIEPKEKQHGSNNDM